ncbi:MAG: SpoIIE family protein phosphatase [Leptospiraceae bacterium]|nr:SpoIIE family protein phosphatase [Leptospiraceae bacterium]
MIRYLLAPYERLTRFWVWWQGFYAGPLLHVLFTSVFATAGFAYGFAQGHIPVVPPEIAWVLSAGVALAALMEVYLNDGLHRLGIRTFIPRVRFVNSMFNEGKLRFDRSIGHYKRLLQYLTVFGRNRMYYAPLHITIVLGTVLIYDFLYLKSGYHWIYIQTAAVALPIHLQFLFVTGDLHMGKYRSLVKRQLFLLGYEPPNQYAISLKFKFLSVMFVIALSDYILISLLRSEVAKSSGGYAYIIGFSLFSLALLMLLTVLHFSTIFMSIKELQLAAMSLQDGHDPDFYSRTSDQELANLSAGFFHAAQKVLNYRRDLEHQIREATAHLSAANEELKAKDHEIQTELDFAAEIQKDMIPQAHPPWNAVQFGIIFKPMQKVSGDFLNVFKKGDSVFVLLADVSGHGVPAALITMAANDAFGLAIRNSDSPAAIFRDVNAQLSEQIKTQDYLTAFLVRIDERLRITYANASHQKALHYKRKANTIEAYDTNGLFIGAMADATETYEEKQSRLHFGDLLILYTDGITEQVNAAGEEFGHARLQEIIFRYHDLPVQELADKIYHEMKTFAGNVRIRDDVSLLALSVHPQYRQFIEMFNETVKSMKRKMLDESSRMLEELWRLYPEFPALPLLSARIYYQLKEYAIAEKHVKVHLEKNPGDLRATQLLAAIALKTGNRTRAANLVNRLSKANADDKITRHLHRKLQ